MGDQERLLRGGSLGTGHARLGGDVLLEPRGRRPSRAIGTMDSITGLEGRAGQRKGSSRGGWGEVEVYLSL